MKQMSSLERRFWRGAIRINALVLAVAILPWTPGWLRVKLMQFALNVHDEVFRRLRLTVWAASMGEVDE